MSDETGHVVVQMYFPKGIDGCWIITMVNGSEFADLSCIEKRDAFVTEAHLVALPQDTLHAHIHEHAWQPNASSHISTSSWHRVSF